MTQPSLLDRILDRTRVSVEDPFVLVRLTAAVVLAIGTLVAAVFWFAYRDTRFLKLIFALWGVYGFIVGVLDGLLTPLVDGAARALQGASARRDGSDYASIEALVAGGHYALAAEEYRQRAQAPRERVAATMRRAALMAGPLESPGIAAAELDALRAGHQLSRNDDLKVGLALVNLYEHQLGEPGRALTELGRLVEHHAGTPRGAALARMLRARKQTRFGAPHTTEDA